MNVEIIMATYNNIKDMKLVFDAYLNQSDSNFSLCIADDGSRDSVKSLVSVYLELGLNIRHLWQADAGFRKAKIVNKGIETSVADYIILTDNDCIPSVNFVADYKRVLHKNKLIIGRRVDLYPPVSDALRNNKIALQRLENPFWLIFQSAVKGLKRPEIGIRFPACICKIWNKKPRKAIGANMGVSRDALLSVNGFDNDFQGYGFEETDLEWRLAKYGLTSQTVLGRCALYHLFHIEKKESKEAELHLQRKRKAGKMRCDNGIL
ncbi:glycosyltransferase [Psychromonas ossibalaenae]|uniref:glycosyltransferase n=1 Tax=Psychromonas ossibalaenae TaxID=444922 RepID=UPI00037B627C|nr:glycosyltransferase [Psychromonas ossibalaenae]